MIILPAIDLINGQVVRLFKGDYEKKTVYADDPLSVALGFKSAGADHLHVVDLDGAKDGGNPNFAVVSELSLRSGLKVEIGGGIRNEETIKRYLDAGVTRVILGTVALTDPDFTASMVEKYGSAVAVGLDLKDGKIATRGWLDVSDTDGLSYCRKLDDMGVSTVICTDISKDGAMSGTNLELYKQMAGSFSFDTVASGGVTSLEDVRALVSYGVYGAILGKALYTGAIDLKAALAAARGENA